MKEQRGEAAGTKRAGLNANQIKYILITAMVIDHIGWGFVQRGSVAWEIMHFFGRLTGPGMAFFLAQGYMHTKDFKKYALRLLAFAVISWPFFEFFEHGHVLPFAVTSEAVKFTLRTWCVPLLNSGRFLVIYAHFGVIYTLFLGLLALKLYDDKKISQPLKMLGIIGLFLLSIFGDWGEFDILFPLVFYRFRDDKK